MKRFIAISGMLGITMLCSSFMMALCATLLKLPIEGVYPSVMIGMILAGSAVSLVAILAFVAREAIKDLKKSE
jgi:hypothetical protein